MDDFRRFIAIGETLRAVFRLALCVLEYRARAAQRIEARASVVAFLIPAFKAETVRCDQASVFSLDSGDPERLNTLL